MDRSDKQQPLCNTYDPHVRGRCTGSDGRRAEHEDRAKPWKKLDISVILRAKTNESESLRDVKLQRDKNRGDPQDNLTNDVNEFDIVWVHENFVRMGEDEDMVWYTMGTEAMLTEPVPISEVYLHGRRPFAFGSSIIEAFRAIPSSIVELGQDMQSATNDNMNQRFDNVRQQLNVRWLAKRGTQIDLRSLRRSVPGSITLVGDVDRDVKELKAQDVTSSSYQEQNLFNLDFDEVTGSFSSSTVNSNKQMGETVGGMKMLKDPSNTMTEYIIKVTAITWIKEVLTQLVALEQEYETDEVLVATAGEKAKVHRVPDNIWKERMDVDIDIGYGVTDPQARIGRLLYGIESIARVAPEEAQRIKKTEMTKEIMGILGYQDGARFFMNDEEYTQYLQENPPQPSEAVLKVEAQKRSPQGIEKRI